MHSIRHLELIRALAQQRHFGRAAIQLGISQPALTRSLKHLEESLGITLFDRDGVTPTLFGNIILRHSEPVLGEFADMMREITLAKGLEIGELRILAGPFAADISALKAVGRLSARHPGLVIRMEILDWTAAIRAVRDGTADLAVAEMAEASADPNLDTEPVSTAQLHFFCASGHPLAAMRAPTIEDLLAFPWVGPTAPARMGAAMPRREGPFGTFDLISDRFMPRITVETFTAARDIVASGVGIGATTAHQIRREIEAGELVLLPVVVPWFRLNYGFITRSNRTKSPAATVFMDMMREIERETAAPV